MAAGLVVPPVWADSLSLVADRDKGFRSGADPIVIEIGGDMPADIVPYLHVEIDAIDVTEFIQRDAEALVYVPPQPLEPGLHELRVVAILPDGLIEEAALWTIEVRASRAFRVAEFNSEAGLTVLQRVSDDLESPPADRTQAQGGIALASRHADEDWKLTSRANTIYNSQQSQTLTGEEFDLSDYQVSSQWAQSNVVLGHQTVSPNSLVLTDFARRGASASRWSGDQRYQGTAFATRTEEVAGFEHITGLDDPDHRTAGVVLSAYPLRTRPERLSLTAVYLDGQGNSQGVAEVNDDFADTAGDAQALIVDSYLADKSWRLRAEYAASSTDFDGQGTGFGAEQGAAVRASVDYDTSRRTSMDTVPDATWNAGLLYQKVEPWFYSLGNTAITADRESAQMQAGYQGRRFGVNGFLSVGEDNVDEVESLPTTEIVSGMLNMSYVPTPRFDAETGAPLSSGPFSNPSFSLTYSYNSLDQIETPVAFAGDDVDSDYNEVLFTAAFSGNAWYWSLSQSFIEQDDKVFDSNTSETVATSLDASFTPSASVSISPVLQQTVTDFPNVGTETKSWVAGATMNVNFSQDWSSSLAYTVNRETADDDSIDSRTRVADLSLQWHYLRPRRNRPGVSFLATGSYQQAEAVDIETDQYQVFLGLNVTWPASL